MTVQLSAMCRRDRFNTCAKAPVDTRIAENPAVPDIFQGVRFGGQTRPSRTKQNESHNVTTVPLDASPQTHESDGTSRTKDA